MIAARIRWLIQASACMLFFLLLTFFQGQEAKAEDSCITCHTNEEMLQDSLGKDSTKKSALQAGPG